MFVPSHRQRAKKDNRYESQQRQCTYLVTYAWLTLDTLPYKRAIRSWLLNAEQQRNPCHLKSTLFHVLALIVSLLATRATESIEQQQSFELFMWQWLISCIFLTGMGLWRINCWTPNINKIRPTVWALARRMHMYRQTAFQKPIIRNLLRQGERRGCLNQ
jgi:hypothetical protein